MYCTASIAAISITVLQCIDRTGVCVFVHVCMLCVCVCVCVCVDCGGNVMGIRHFEQFSAAISDKTAHFGPANTQGYTNATRTHSYAHNDTHIQTHRCKETSLVYYSLLHTGTITHTHTHTHTKHYPNTPQFFTQ